MNSNGERNRHILEVREWLKKNVLHYDVDESIKLFDFDVDWELFSGSFQMQFDDEICPHRGCFSVGSNGKICFYLPMFHSPLGAPASYSAIHISSSVEEKISDSLASLLPPLMPLGLSRQSGVHITTSTPFCDRIYDNDKFAVAKQKISNPQFILVVQGDLP